MKETVHRLQKMKIVGIQIAIFLTTCSRTSSFLVVPAILSGRTSPPTTSYAASSDNSPSQQSESKKGDNRAMAFLKKIGKVGGAANKDFRHAIGIDEGVGKTQGENQVNKKTRFCL